MLCLRDLEKRINQPLALADFEKCPMGVQEAWERHVAARGGRLSQVSASASARAADRGC
jgi:hypothetical protein